MENALNRNAVSQITASEKSQASALTALPMGGPLLGAQHLDLSIGIRPNRPDAPQSGFSSNSTIRNDLAALGVDIGDRQSGILAETYGTGPTTLRDMNMDGVLSGKLPGQDGLSWSLNWSAMRPDRLANAVLRLGVEGAGIPYSATSGELARGLDRVFGLTGVLSAKTARKIVRLYGEGGQIDKAQIARTLNLAQPGREPAAESGPIRVLRALESGRGRPAVGPLGLPGPVQGPEGAREWNATRRAMVAYVMSFASRQGDLTRPQFAQALLSLPAIGAPLDSRLASALFAAYSSIGTGGPFISRAEVKEMVRSKALIASPMKNGCFGLAVDLSSQPVFKAAAGEPNVRMFAKFDDRLTLPAAPVILAGPNQAIAPQPMPLQRDIEDDAGERQNTSTASEGVSQLLPSLGLNATIFGTLIIDDDRLQQRKRHHLADLAQLDLTEMFPEQIAAAIYSQAGRNPDVDCLTTDEFATALRELTADTEALTGGIAEVMVRLANTTMLTLGHSNGLHSRACRGAAVHFDGLVTLFERHFVDIQTGISPKPYRVQHDFALAFVDPELVAEFLCSFTPKPLDLLQETDLRDALTSAAFSALADAGATARRLCRFLEEGNRIMGNSAAVIFGNLARSHVIGRGDDPREGLQVDLSRLPKELFANAMFHHFGLDPETAALTAAQFEEGLERLADGTFVISAADIDFLVMAYASDRQDDGARLTHADICSILLGEVGLKAASGKPDLQLLNLIDPGHRRPAYANPASWDRGASLAGGFANDLVRAASEATGLSVNEVTKVVGNIGSWGLRDPDVGKRVHDALRNLWSSAAPAVTGAVTALTLKLKSAPGLSTASVKFLDDSCALFRARGSNGKIFLHLFWTAKSELVRSVDAAAQSLHPNGADPFAGPVPPRLWPTGAALAAQPAHGGRARAGG
jgi:hypothetical protein